MALPKDLLILRPSVPARRGTSVSSVCGSGKTSPKYPVEAADDLPGQLEVGGLVLADGDDVGPVDDDVGRLEDGVAEEAVGVEVLSSISCCSP